MFAVGTWAENGFFQCFHFGVQEFLISSASVCLFRKSIGKGLRPLGEHGAPVQGTGLRDFPQNAVFLVAGQRYFAAKGLFQRG